jgi:hypothetical protein
MIDVARARRSFSGPASHCQVAPGAVRPRVRHPGPDRTPRVRSVVNEGVLPNQPCFKAFRLGSVRVRELVGELVGALKKRFSSRPTETIGRRITQSGV